MRETGVAFACWYLYGVETAIAFAGEKKPFFVHFSVAEVLPVSMVADQGRAVVPAVSLGDRELTGSGTAVPRPMMAAVVHAVRS